MADTKPCPICRKPAGRPPGNRLHPFCSERCRTIDLGKWLNEEYRVPSREETPETLPEGDETLH